MRVYKGSEKQLHIVECAIISVCSGQEMKEGRTGYRTDRLKMWKTPLLHNFAPTLTQQDCRAVQMSHLEMVWQSIQSEELGVRKIQVQIPLLILPGWVALHKCINLSDSHFLHLENKSVNKMASKVPSSSEFMIFKSYYTVEGVLGLESQYEVWLNSRLCYLLILTCDLGQIPYTFKALAFSSLIWGSTYSSQTFLWEKHFINCQAP